ncbi:unnamed protein product [Polarella glacialis]|uniref:Uncharacterized protein n=1 Tax=Polarella glacialis TaxID=89957 RepID=A0A813G8Z4_POLGL|nr:unnamed protein product [Polarella glacialis]
MVRQFDLKKEPIVKKGRPDARVEVVLSFRTLQGSMEAVRDPRELFSLADVGSSFWVTFDLVEQDGGGGCRRLKNVIAVDRNPCEGFCALHSARAVLCQPQSRKILFLSENNTPEGKVLARRLRSLLPDEDFLETIPSSGDRTPDYPMAELDRFAAEAALDGIDLSKLSCAELAGLANLSTAEGYQSFFGTQRISRPTALHRLERLEQSSAIQKVVDACAREADAREQAGRQVPHATHTLLSSKVTCQRKAGNTSSGLWEFRSSDDEPQCADHIAEAIRCEARNSAFVHAMDIECPRTADPCSLVVKDRLGAWMQKIFIVLVDEAVADASLGLPLGLLSKPIYVKYPPRWIDVGDMNALSVALHHDAALGFADLPLKIAELAARADHAPEQCMRLVMRYSRSQSVLTGCTPEYGWRHASSASSISWSACEWWQWNQSHVDNRQSEDTRNFEGEQKLIQNWRDSEWQSQDAWNSAGKQKPSANWSDGERQPEDTWNSKGEHQLIQNWRDSGWQSEDAWNSESKQMRFPNWNDAERQLEDPWSKWGHPQIWNDAGWQSADTQEHSQDWSGAARR